jgi:hypothetical protein
MGPVTALRDSSLTGMLRKCDSFPGDASAPHPFLIEVIAFAAGLDNATFCGAPLDHSPVEIGALV